MKTHRWIALPLFSVASFVTAACSGVDGSTAPPTEDELTTGAPTTLAKFEPLAHLDEAVKRAKVAASQPDQISVFHVTGSVVGTPGPFDAARFTWRYVFQVTKVGAGPSLVTVSYPGWQAKVDKGLAMGATASVSDLQKIAVVRGSSLLADLSTLKITPSTCALTSLQLQGNLAMRPGSTPLWYWDLVCGAGKIVDVDADSGKLLSP